VVRLDVHRRRTVLRDQEVARDVLPDLALDHGLQQKRLGHDAMYRRVEVGEEQTRELKARLVDHMTLRSL
jgi:hypothetical protein